MHKKPFIYILIRSRNSFDTFARCINSVFFQSYKNYQILFVDDASKYSTKTKRYIRKRLKNHISVFNKTRKYSLLNGYEMTHKYATKDGAVIFNLDGDDWLPHPHCLSEVAKAYSKDPELQMTYGECFIWDGKNMSEKSSHQIMPHTNVPYSPRALSSKTFYQEPFLPLHPRTWKASAFKSIPKNMFLNSRGKWIRFAEDMAIFFALFQKYGTNYKVIQKPIYIYNKMHPNSDVIKNTLLLVKDELEIRRKYHIQKPFKERSPIKIFHSQALSILILKNILYKFQHLRASIKVPKKIFISPNNQGWKGIINKIDKSQPVYIKSTELTNILKRIKNYKVLNNSNIDPKTLDTKSLYNLMWTLVFCDAVTQKTQKALGTFLPKNYPTIYPK